MRVGILAVLAALWLMGAPVGTARAQTGGAYEIAAWTVGSGGPVDGGGYELAGGVGQPAVGVAAAGDYRLDSGLWPGSVQIVDVYLPGVVRFGAP